MTTTSSNNKRIAKNTLFLYVRLTIVLFVSIYITRVVLEILGVTDYGIYNVVAGFVTMFGFINSSMTNAIQRFYNYTMGKGQIEDMNKVYNISLLVQSVLAFILLVVVEVIGLWYINNRMVLNADRIIAANWIFQFSVFSLMFVMFQIPYSAAIMAHEKINFYALVGIIDVFLKLLGILLLPYFSIDKLIAYGSIHLFISFISFLLYCIYAYSHFEEIKIRRCTDIILYKEIFKFSGWNLLETLSWMIQSQGLNMVMNLFFGPAINAARAVSVQIQSALRGFCLNLVTAFRPQLTQSYAQGNYSRCKDMFYVMSKSVFLLFFALSVPVIIEIDYILGLWLGDNIPPYTNSFTVLTLLALFVRNYIVGLSQIVHASGIMKKYNIWSSITIFSVVPVAYIVLLNGASPVLVYWLSIIMCIILLCICFNICNHIFLIGIKNYLSIIIMPSVIISIIVPIVPYYVHVSMEESFIRLIVVTILNACIMMITSYYLFLNNREKDFLKSFIYKTIKKESFTYRR